MKRLIINSKLHEELTEALIKSAGHIARIYNDQNDNPHRITVTIWSTDRLDECYMMAHSKGLNKDGGAIYNIAID